jgi:hypothetical protein
MAIGIAYFFMLAASSINKFRINEIDSGPNQGFQIASPIQLNFKH